MNRLVNRRLNKLADILCNGERGVRKKQEATEAEHVKKEAAAWLNSADIQGVAVDTKKTNHEDTGEPCITIYVNQKRPLSDVSSQIPETLSLPTGERISLDVEEVGELEAHTSFSQRLRPIFSGVSIAHHDRQPGTLGLIVRSKQPPHRHYAMSCAHVIAPFPESHSNTIYQPSKPENGAQKQFNIGEYVRGIPIDFSAHEFTNQIDAAIAALNDSAAFTPIIPYIGPLKGVSARINNNTFVKVVGMVSGRTAGQVLNNNYRARINYYDARGNKLSAGFQRVVLCTSYAKPGDSGAAVLNSSDKLIGIHLGGSSSHSVFCRAVPALNYFDVWPLVQT